MPGTLNILDLTQGKNISLENVDNIGVAGDFLVINFTDGVTVLRQSGDIGSAQFTPYPQDDGESPEGEGSDNQGTE